MRERIMKLFIGVIFIAFLSCISAKRLLRYSLFVLSDKNPYPILSVCLFVFIISLSHCIYHVFISYRYPEIIILVACYFSICTHCHFTRILIFTKQNWFWTRTAVKTDSNPLRSGRTLLNNLSLHKLLKLCINGKISFWYQMS